MNLVDRISECFASLKYGNSRYLEGFDSWVYRKAEENCVMISVPETMSVSEHFMHCRLYTQKLYINGLTCQNYLILSCDRTDLRKKFAFICAQFLSMGENGIDRHTLLHDPVTWWKEWRELLGNVSVSKEPYAIIAEMHALYRLYQNNDKIVWTALDRGTHDLEDSQTGYEVKSTISKIQTSIVISSQFQLRNSKPLYLLFYRMERSENGISINYLYNKLCELGYDKIKLDEQLAFNGYETGSSIRNKCYQIIEAREYCVDDTFPKITPSSFKNDRIPEAVSHIEYTVDLSSIPYEEWEKD